MSEALEVADTGDQHVEQSEPAETRARRMGWTDKEEFRGDPGKWVDAETFVKRGEEILPIVQANNKALEKALKESNAKIADLQKTFGEFQKFASKAEQRANERARADLEAQLETAAAAGDVNGVREANKGIVELTSRVEDEAPAAHPKGWTPDYVEAVEAFESENSWFGNDRSMTAWAKAMDSELAEDGVEPKARLKQLAKLAREEFPHKFRNANRDLPGAVEGGAVGARRAGGKTWADLPAAAKAQADSFVKKIPGYTRDKYLKDYDWS